MKKLKYLINYGLKKRMYSKAFLISNVVVAVILLLIAVVPSLIAGSFDDGVVNDKVGIIMTPNNGFVRTTIENDVQAYLGSMQLTDQVEYIDASDDFDVLYDNINNKFYYDFSKYFEEEHSYGGLVYIEIDNDVLKIKYFNQSLRHELDLAFQNALSNIRVKYYLDLFKDEIPDGAFDPTNLQFNYPEGGEQQDDFSMILAAIAPIFVVPLFIIITFGLQMIGTEIIEEKSTKAIEIIIASVPPKTHFVAKILSVMIFLTLQLLLYVAYGILGFMINSVISASTQTESWITLLAPVADLIIPTVVIILLCAVFGGLLYLVIGAFVASLAVNQEDYQQIQTPVMMILMVGYFASIIAGTAQLDWLVAVLNYIPFVSPMTLPGAFIAGQIDWVGLIISMGILIGVTALVILFIAPLYRASILNYDQSKLFKRIKNAMREAKTFKENQKTYLAQGIVNDKH
jgi:ABC-2 type transport system permease protein